MSHGLRHNLSLRPYYKQNVAGVLFVCSFVVVFFFCGGGGSFFSENRVLLFSSSIFQENYFLSI